MNGQSCKYPEWREPKAIKTSASAPGSIQIAREKKCVTMSTPIEELQSDVEDEVEKDLESKLKGELESINEKLNTTTITLSGATSNHNYKKIAGKEPVLSLMIPNSLFSLWKQRREIEERLLQDKSTLTEMANASLNKIIKLNTCASDLETRLQNELSRFQANYRKAAGRRRYKILSKVTNIMLLKDEVVPNVSL